VIAPAGVAGQRGAHQTRSFKVDVVAASRVAWMYFDGLVSTHWEGRHEVGAGTS
jgi:hypothetical protein